MARVAVPKPKVKMPKTPGPKIGAKLPTAPKAPQLASNMTPYMNASQATMPQLPKKGLGGF